MAHNIGDKLGMAKKLMLAMAGAFALAFPIFIGLSHAPSSQAQSPTGPKPSFDVASVKISNNCGSGFGSSSTWTSVKPYQPGGRYIVCRKLKSIIYDVYLVDPVLPIIGGPSWIDDTYFQIEAKAEGNPDIKQMRIAVQSLLEERFKLKMHSEKRLTSVYLLVVEKGGHKLKLAKETREKGIGFTMKGDELVMEGKAVSMADFANDLARFVEGRKVIDKTGLSELYDITLVCDNPFRPSNIEEPTSAKPLSTASIFTAIREQLGLRMEASKAQLDHFVIDSVEKPSEN